MLGNAHSAVTTDTVKDRVVPCAVALIAFLVHIKCWNSHELASHCAGVIALSASMSGPLRL